MESGAGIIAGNGWDIGWEILYRAVRRLFKTFAGRFFLRPGIFSTVAYAAGHKGKG